MYMKTLYAFTITRTWPIKQFILYDLKKRNNANNTHSHTYQRKEKERKKIKHQFLKKKLRITF